MGWKPVPQGEGEGGEKKPLPHRSRLVVADDGGAKGMSSYRGVFPLGGERASRQRLSKSSAGAGCCVHSSNWAAACLTNIWTPSMVRQPRSRAALSIGVSMGL